MNPFKAVGKVIAFPVTAAKTTVRLVKAERAATTVLETLDEGADHPEDYRDLAWWRRLLTAAAGLVQTLPLPAQGRLTMNNWLLKIGAIASATASIAASLHGAGLPAGADHYVTIIGGIAAMVFSYLHPSPSQPAQP